MEKIRKGRFEKLIQMCQKQNISLEDLQVYLKYRLSPEIREVTRLFKKQKLNFRKLYRYLEKLAKKQEVSSIPEKALINRIGIKLLQEAKVDLLDLNNILKRFPLKKISSKELLRILFLEKKISIDEFLQIFKAHWSEIEHYHTSYKMRETQDRLEFYLENHKANTIGPYEVLEEIGKGGMGIVYKAYHPELNQTFAVKILKAGELAKEVSIKRFIREIQMMAKLKHPGIIQIIGSGEDRGKHYFSMEFVDGLTLDRHLKKGFTIRDSVSLIQKILESLHFAHLQGIIHRDLKLGNIFLNRNGEPKLGDFGLAKNLLEADKQKLTQSGTILGTSNYLSPEQAMGETKKIDARADIYSLGICLYRMTTKKFPFKGDSYQDLIRQIVEVKASSPSTINKTIHRDLDTILLKALEKSPEKRYQTAQAFANDLGRFLAGHPIYAKEDSYLGKIHRWGFQNRKQMLSFLVVGLCFFLFLFTFRWSQNQDFQNRIDDFYLKALQKKELASKVADADFKSKASKIKHLLQAFNFLNEALKLDGKQKEIQKEKLIIGKSLIKLACQSEEYGLADYITQKIQKLSILQPTEKNALGKYIEEEKRKTLIQNFQRLEDLITKLKIPNVDPEFRKDAIFEISKMQQPAILEHLKKILLEGGDYFLRSDFRSKGMDEYHKTVVLILGRMENSLMGEPLFDIFQKMTRKILAQPKRKRIVPDIQYAIVLAQALGNLKVFDKASQFNHIRDRFPQEGLFWRSSKNAYNKILGADSLKTPKTLDARAYNEIAYLKLRKQDFYGAIADYTKSIQLDPTFVLSYVGRGVCYKNLKNYDKAIADYTKAIELKPQEFSAYNNRALVKRMKGDLRGAIKDLTQSIQINPLNGMTSHNRGLLWMELNRPTEAINDFTQTLNQDPQYLAAYLDRGRVYVNLKKLKLALKDFNKAIKLAPTSSRAYNYRGLAYLKENVLNKAIDDFEHAIELQPKNGVAYGNRGEAKRKIGDIDGAIMDFTEAIRLKPGVIDYYWVRGNLYLEKNQKEKGKSDFQDILKLTKNAKSRRIQRIRQEIEELLSSLK